ncbi:hypothetical protein CDES_00815 [Corynebacterium deserti GIMN1.010]|uniref:2-dehydro-3-deoxy-phosphogluconate aldolase n=1 Tax=Corynebacterium deserti GIMN1.010 TaxID=931089 RepID=A0A0M3Q8Y1_9CORY|nr:bifunctional 4-hydroxy-2-oxoglutarate aldolase/2-dehydro-3-deoxy-phosphogluconate aldolase [Corynebacterium deserti]ALC04643.1 hypothetical protein CDES_00815 [Corynebacterium deserti GIMN1.010]
MSFKLHTLNALHSTGALLIIRTPDADSAYNIAAAAIEGGIRCLEIPFGVPGALGAIEKIASTYGHQGVYVGAGTVLDAQSAYAAVNAGSSLLVSPNVNDGVLEIAQRHQVVSMPGAFTPTEIQTALEKGADVVKLFPAELHGPAYLKSLRTPLSHAPIAPTGGVSPDTVEAWFAAGAFSVGVSSYICKAGSAKEVTERSQILLQKIAEVRS